jgi:hypothetical protein
MWEEFIDFVVVGFAGLCLRSKWRFAGAILCSNVATLALLFRFNEVMTLWHALLTLSGYVWFQIALWILSTETSIARWTIIRKYVHHSAYFMFVQLGSLVCFPEATAVLEILIACYMLNNFLRLCVLGVISDKNLKIEQSIYGSMQIAHFSAKMPSTQQLYLITKIIAKVGAVRSTVYLTISFLKFLYYTSIPAAVSLVA